MNYKFVAIFLVLLCCFMGAVSAADAVDASVDDAVTVDAVSEDIGDSVTADPILSEDTTTEEINEATIEKENKDVEQTRGTPTNAADWEDLEDACESSGAKDITLTGTIYNANSQINFKNSATIIGTPNSYITGGVSGTPTFYSSGSYSIHFINVTFKDINSDIFMQLSTTGVNTFENCNFLNITTTTANGHSSVIWNNGGFMNITDCNFTNCVNGFGVITNHKTPTTVTMNVNNCRFENNYARTEPGAINNCGILNVTNSIFNNNTSYQWGGAIHTHSNAYSRIINSTFTDNNAGWNGGAMYTYSKLEVINSTFTNNSCNSSAGGGAIGCSNWMSKYNITVCNCTFINNTNNCGVTNETPSTGTGGAISAMNNGYLTVCGSTFDNNYAGYGQAIAAYSQGYVNITAGIPNVVIKNNTFLNHNRTTATDTVEVSGNYTLDNNTFINCHQVNRNGTGNVFTNCTPESLNNANPTATNKALLSSNGRSSTNILKDEINYLTPEDNIRKAIRNLEDNGIIYLSNGEFFYDNSIIDFDKNYTIIGQSRDGTIFIKRFEGSTECQGVKTFINMTIRISEPLSDEDPIQTVDLESNSVFINCTFIGTPINMGKNLFDQNIESHGALDYKDVYSAKFYNCEFLNSDRDNTYTKTVEEWIWNEQTEENEIITTVYTLSSYINVFDHAIVELYDCTFDNLTYDTLFCTNVANYDTGSVKIYNSTFKNCAMNAVVDYYTDLEDIVAIEDCDYDFDATTGVIASEDGAHHYVNATKLAKPDTTLVADVDDAGNLLVSLTAGGSAVANGKVLISVNGAEAVSYDLGEDGTLSIALSDLTDATGKLNIDVSFEETDDYKGSTGSASAVLVVKTVTEKIDPVATSITASDITATAKIAKTLSITLKDANGNALASKAVKVTVNGKTSTVTTDKNGVAKVTVNYAKAGTYYYTFNYLGDNDYKASIKPVKVTVNKQATKATFAKKTFKVKATKKISFTLKDSKGKAIAKKKITFKVNGKTYTAKTNSKGVATVKIVIKKKGKYTATAKFAGDTTYKAVSKKAAITIK